MEYVYYFLGFILFMTLLDALIPKRRNIKKHNKKRVKNPEKTLKSNTTRNISHKVRADEIILTLTLEEMSGFEFERLLSMYFHDVGYKVEEPGVGGKDGGVDLVLIGKHGERTAVQAKCYTKGNIGVEVIRAFNSAKRNHNCVLTLLITTSDLTKTAKEEAEQYNMEYWHGTMLMGKLKKWGRWTPKVNSR